MYPKVLIFLLTALLLSFCSNPQKNENSSLVDTNDSLVNSEVAVSNTNGFRDEIFRELKLPLSVDTLFIQNVDTAQVMKYTELRSDAEDIFLDNPVHTGLQWRVDEFRRIDSIKVAGGYNEYLNKLDIGMMKDCKGFCIGRIAMPNGYKMYLWGLDYGSYEACPYYSGRVIFGTVPTENGRYHFIIGEESGSGDPPATGNTRITSRVNTEGTIEIIKEEYSDDLDVPGANREIIVCRLKIDDGKNFVDELKREKHFTEAESH
jgi:hypothetical protein